MNIMRISFCVLTVLALFSVAEARQLEVPELPYPQIQWAIDDAQDGDTVSVWGYGDPPFTYYENVNFLGKGIFVVNRSFLPNQVQYDSSWDHV